MKEITIYVTDCGRRFEVKRKAEIYEKKRELIIGLKRKLNLEDHIERDIETYIEIILDNSELIRKIVS